jgi:hypothetical protein
VSADDSGDLSRRAELFDGTSRFDGMSRSEAVSRSRSEGMGRSGFATSNSIGNSGDVAGPNSITNSGDVGRSSSASGADITGILLGSGDSSALQGADMSSLLEGTIIDNSDSEYFVSLLNRVGAHPDHHPNSIAGLGLGRSGQLGITGAVLPGL